MIKRRVQVFVLSNWLVGVVISSVMRWDIYTLRHLSVCASHHWLYSRCTGWVDCLIAQCSGMHCCLTEKQVLPWPCFVLTMHCPVHAMTLTCSTLSMLCPGYALPWPCSALVMLCLGHVLDILSQKSPLYIYWGKGLVCLYIQFKCSFDILAPIKNREESKNSFYDNLLAKLKKIIKSTGRDLKFSRKLVKWYTGVGQVFVSGGEVVNTRRIELIQAMIHGQIY